ncbi:hypothetical protein BUALT_Bualt02G0215400 [Buddleja alternifolia]|uniref:PPM-type phosphatase domain-containing protein n=1 Tax=Buddleja alternifolia TaxID=168488 RepID=A0AAV6YCT8_9LAMI|nr:hypothetical protein BUALT_Bualt02G0215400 [Buddleja alternifolia]
MTMKGLLVIACLGVFLCTLSYVNPYTVHEVSVSCMMAYEEGGPRAVISSPECPQWVLSAEPFRNLTRNCQFATLQGHREYQEDRVACNLDVKLPFSGNGVPEEVTIGIAAIFDGHGGEEASEMASKKLFDYFFMHVVFTAYKLALPKNKNHDSDTAKSSQCTSQMIDRNPICSILEEALLMTIQDIDSEFSKACLFSPFLHCVFDTLMLIDRYKLNSLHQEALENGCVSGSTATFVLLIKGQFLIANIGDSKTVLCSQKIHSHYAEGASSEIYVEELTRDHHPDREDEKARIEAAGGFVRLWGVPRVNGILAVSRSIGDVYLKRYGVIAEPEITGWRAFTPENRYMVVASDGIFETLTPQDVCDLVHDKASECTSSSSLAEWIVRHAFKTGSTDNLSAIVISDLHNETEDRCDIERNPTP